MVQIIPRAKPTFGEQITGGFQSGFGLIPQLAQIGIESGLQQKAKQADYSRRLQGLEQLKKTPFWEQASDWEKALIEGELRGDISAQLASSISKSRREQAGRDWTSQRLEDLENRYGSQQQELQDSEEMPQEFEGIPTGRPRISNAEKEKLKLQATFPGPEGEFAKRTLDEISKEEERAFIPKEAYYKHAAEENAKFMDRISSIEDDLPNTEFALAGIQDALGNAGKWAAIQDKIADATGFEGARSAAGSELESFIKNYFLGDLTSIKGGRANVFLEKQIRDAYPKAGRDPIANQKVALGMKLKEEINRLQVDRTREMEKFYLKNLGHLPPGFKSKVKEDIKDEVTSLEKKAIDQLHHMSRIEEQRDKIFRKYVKPGEVLMMDESGNPFAVPEREEIEYREQGYIPLGKK